MKKSDHPYEHMSWAHQALLELICVASPEMQPNERLEYGQKLYGGFPSLQKFKMFSVNWKIKYIYLWEKAFPKTSPYIFLWISLVLNFKQNKVCRNLLNSRSQFFLWRNETAWESMAVQLFHMEEEWPALSTAGGSLHCQSEAAHKWHPVGISTGLPPPEDFRTYLTHLHELPLPLPFISDKRPKLKWKINVFVNFPLTHVC